MTIPEKSRSGKGGLIENYPADRGEPIPPGGR